MSTGTDALPLRDELRGDGARELRVHLAVNEDRPCGVERVGRAIEERAIRQRDLGFVVVFLGHASRMARGLGPRPCPCVSIRVRGVDGSRARGHAFLVMKDRAANDNGIDPFVERALAALRAEPARSWTVASLARVAGLSRAPFARRFREATGTSPRRWLTAHRLEIAREQLAAGTSERTLSEVADMIGYASEFAFSKAFTRVIGVPPGEYRRIARSRIQPGTFRAAA